jgi:hypothetical protein
LEDGKPVPPASAAADLHPAEAGGFIGMLALDMDAYAKKYGNKRDSGNRQAAVIRTLKFTRIPRL